MDKEITNFLKHKIFDLNEKVSIIEISEKWNLDLSKTSKLLSAWTTEQKDTKFKQHHLIRGFDSNGNLVVTIVPEDSKINNKFENFIEILYSIQISQNGIESNNLDKRNCMNLILENYTKETVVEENDSDVTEVVVETKEISVEKHEIKKIAKPEPTPVPIVPKESKKETVKHSKNKSSPDKMNSKVKNSISSFFSKPSQVKKPIDKVKIVVEEDVKIVPNDTSTTTIENKENDIKDDNNKVDDIPKVTNKRKREVQKRKKGSRIMQICDDDTDDSDENEKTSPIKENMKLSDNEDIFESNGIVENNEKSKNCTEKNEAHKIRTKKRRTVVKTYEDEDGFLVTSKKREEYSSSEEEEKKVEPPPTKPIKKDVQQQSKPVKKISKPSKQGSITNFFTKK